MKGQETEKFLQKEFGHFMQMTSLFPPAAISEGLCAKIHRKLNPSLARVFFAVAGIHALSSFFTLSFCPHFGLSVIPGFVGLPILFMKVNMEFCMLACGAIFMTTGTLTSLLFLPTEYVRVLYRFRLAVPIALTFVSCAVLVAMGEKIAFYWLFFWILGGASTSLAALTLGIQWSSVGTSVTITRAVR